MAMPAAANQFRSARTLPKIYMKPLSQISRQFGSHRGEELPVGSRLEHPAIDCQYQATGGDFRVATDRLKPSSTPAVSPSLRRLSSRFLSEEMKRDYLAEALCFVILISVSAWPIVSMVRALSWLK
jgi:hypothetical protein